MNTREDRRSVITRLKPGTRLRSAVSTIEIIVLKSPDAPIELCCGGRPMLETGAGSPSVDEALAGETLLGKRYAHAGTALEVLCTAGGKGWLTVNGEPLEVKIAKKLPGSD